MSRIVPLISGPIFDPVMNNKSPNCIRSTERVPRPARLVGLGLLITLGVSSAIAAPTGPFTVRRSSDPATVRTAPTWATPTLSPFDDDDGVLDDGELHYYVVDDALGQPLALSVHKHAVSQTVRVSFNDGDSSSAPVDSVLSTVSVAPPAVPANGLSTIEVTVLPRDAYGVFLGAGLQLTVDENALLPGVLSGAIVDRGDGSYVFHVISSEPGQGTAEVSVEDLLLDPQPLLTYQTVFDTEFQLNTTTQGKQERPAAGQAADGGLVVVWQGEDGDDKGIFGRVFDADGSLAVDEFQANATSTGKQDAPAVGVASDRSFVVVWQGADSDDKAIVGRLFDAGGQASGGEFQVNTTEVGKQDGPRVAMGSDGSFVVVWQGEDADDTGTFARVYDSGGLPFGDEFRVNVDQLGKQASPDVAMAGDGGFVVVWEGLDADDKGIFARQFDSAGIPLGGEFVAHAGETGKQDKPRVDMADDGEFVVVWQADDADRKGVYARRHDFGGNPLEPEFLVNTVTLENQDRPDVAMADDGGWVVVWKSKAAGQQALGQRFAADGQPEGGEFVLSDAAEKPDRPDVAIAADGTSFFVIWQAEDANHKGTFGRWILID